MRAAPIRERRLIDHLRYAFGLYLSDKNQLRPEAYCHIFLSNLLMLQSSSFFCTNQETQKLINFL